MPIFTARCPNQHHPLFNLIVNGATPKQPLLSLQTEFAPAPTHISKHTEVSCDNNNNCNVRVDVFSWRQFIVAL